MNEVLASEPTSIRQPVVARGSFIALDTSQRNVAPAANRIHGMSAGQRSARSSSSAWSEESVSAGSETWIANELSDAGMLSGQRPERRRATPRAKQTSKRRTL